MINVSSDVLAKIKNILKKHFPDAEFRAFGSRVSGKAKPYSDLDIAVVGKRELDFATLNNLKYAFEESELPFRVDIIDWNSTSESFKKIILEKYEIL